MGVETPLTAKTGKRAGRRSRVLLAAKLVTPQGEIDARLRDLSPKGALIECTKVPPVNTKVVFVRGPLEVPARVAWAGADRAGLEFEHQVDENDILVQLGKKGSAHDDPYRPVNLPNHLSRSQYKLAKAWGVTVGFAVSSGPNSRKDVR
jgi:hypothetical protein